MVRRWTCLLALTACGRSGSEPAAPAEPVDSTPPTASTASPTGSTGATAATGDSGPVPTAHTGAPSTASTASTAHTADSADPTDTATSPDEGLYPDVPYDCSKGVPAGPFVGTPVAGVVTTEDFAFDLDGHLVAAGPNDIVVRYLADGTVTPVAGAVSSRGFELLPDGDVAIADPDGARLVRLDLGSGAVSLVGTTFVGMAGIAVDAEGQVYGTYLSPGRVTATDATTGTTTVLGSPTIQTYGAELSVDEQTLYVAGYSAADPTIYAYDRAGGGWGTERVLATVAGSVGFGGLAVDACDNVYAVEPQRCRVWRIDPLGAAEVVADASASFCASVEFGSGLGGWSATTLYMATYDEVVAFDVGVPGRPR